MKARALIGGLAALLVGALAWRVLREPADVAPRTAAPEDSAERPTPTPASTPSSNPSPAAPPAPHGPAAKFVAENGCAACHSAQSEAWRGSHHDLAMQEARADTVLGDFGDVRFTDASTDTRFFRDERGYAVETENQSGERARFDVPYVFGVDPLQQVLLPTTGGRLQALSVAWDTNAKRWFSLYPDERIDARDPLHWTRPALNWNFTCAECHATDLRRNYDAATDTYTTTWQRIDVGCQACHGPAERHLEWALAYVTGEDAEDVPGLGFDAPVKASATREVEACARCHARRAPLGDGFDHRNRLLDDYLPAFLTEGLYHADGQIQDEVYEYGSFVQSKMHARGVRCSDCHEPHSLALRRPGNLLCTGCHSPTPNTRPEIDVKALQRKQYDTAEHYHHAPGTSGSQCVDCHMATRTYMVVDPRRDHGFRVPRPDLASETGAPDACTGCHKERDAAWAAKTIAGWSDVKKPSASHFGVALQAGRTARPGAVDALLALARSQEEPIVRATALTELTRYPSRPALDAFGAALEDPDGLVRLAALEGFELLPGPERVPAVGPLLTDPLRAVRAAAARLLEEVPAQALGPYADAAHAALGEYEAIQVSLRERPEARLNLAQLLRARGDTAGAEAELRTALKLDRLYVPTYVNLADLVRATKSESEAEGVLRDGLARVPDSGALHHALGLALVRQERHDEGLAELRRGAELEPRDARLGYVLSVALHDLGKADEARVTLAQVLARSPGDRDARFTLAEYLAESGDAEGARRTLAELAAINPYDPGLAGAGVDPRAGGR